MRLALTGKSEKIFIELMKECEVDNPTHLNNLMITFIKNNPNIYQEAIKYAQTNNMQKLQEKV